MKRGTKVWLIIAAILFLLGTMIIVGDFIMVKFDFAKIATTKYVTNTYEIQENYKNIKIVTNTANVALVPSKDAKDTVVCKEEENVKHLVEVKDDTLVIKVIDTRKWYEHIGINFGTSKITLYLSKDIYDALSIKTSTGKVSVENLSADTLDITVSTGNIRVTDVVCKGDMKMKVSTGDIKLDKSDAAEIFIKTSTGNVTGTLLTEKVFITQTSTGNIKVPKSIKGGRCEITTSTGNIKINYY